MSKEELLQTITDELVKHPTEDVKQLYEALKHTSTKAFRQVWQSLRPGEAVTWQELTRRLHRHG